MERVAPVAVFSVFPSVVVVVSTVLRGSIVLQLSVVQLGKGGNQSSQHSLITATYETRSTMTPARSVCCSVHKTDAQQPLIQPSTPEATLAETMQPSFIMELLLSLRRLK